jgi:muconolactone delta-isomerase
MRFAIIYHPKFPAPQDEIPELLKGMGKWMQEHGSRIEGIQFFVDGGGFGILDTDDPGELSRLISEHPFTPYSDVEIKPVMDPESAMAVLTEVYG